MMLFWIAAALLTVLAVAFQVAPLVRAHNPPAPATGRFAARVYRDQLDEIGRDLARGTIAAAEAEAARAEIGRRLLAEGEAGPDAMPAAAPRRHLATAITALIPVAALGMYFWLGTPEPPAPMPGAQQVLAAAERLEAQLQTEPDDVEGWSLLAETWKRLGRFDRAAASYRGLLRARPDDAGVQLALAEMLVMQAEGKIGAEPRALFQARQDQPMARFYLAEAALQDGNREAALTAWQKLLQDSPAGAPWVALVQARLNTVGGAQTQQPGPSGSDVAAAAEMSPEARQQMINGMVGRLRERLAQQPDDAEGWRRLARAERVLGNEAASRAAFEQLARLLPGDAEALQALGKTN